MNIKTCLSIAAVLAVMGALAVVPAVAGEYHSGATLICADCHTMHFSMQHSFDGTTPVPTTAQQNGNWLGASGPNSFLLKAPANQLCLSCHDGQSFAPDVLGDNSNASPSQGREAGALNEVASGAPYDTWKGHTLDSTAPPPGYNPAVIGASPTWYTGATDGLECISCHAQHGPATSYRNLGPYALGGAAAAARPTYDLSTTNDALKDVWVNISAPYKAGTGVAATFNPYYATANISFNRIDAAVGTAKTSNKMDTFCAACHGNFHGGPADTNIGATAAALDGFIRHPTSQVTIGAAGGQGYGGHSSLSRFAAATAKVKVYASDRTGYTDTSPGCVACHKGHGNQNPFGLIFMSRTEASPNEQGSTVADTMLGQRNLCGQCHGQGA